MNEFQRKSMYYGQKEMAKQSVLYLKNEIQKELWEQELTGQISDGMWENTNNTGWVYWCNLKTDIGPTTELIGTIPHNIKNNFGFSRLIEYVGDRMVDIGKKYDSEYNETKLRMDLREISKAIKGRN